MAVARAGAVEQVFTLTSSDSETYANPSGALEPMPGTELDFTLRVSSLLVITFCARGSVQPSGSQMIPMAFIQCHLDGSPCEPDGSGPLEFHFPQYCCDTRSFSWVAPKVSAGSHTVTMLWGLGNPTSFVIERRSLIVQAARLGRRLPTP